MSDSRRCPDCGSTYVATADSTTHAGCPGSGTLAAPSPPDERTLAASAGHFAAPAETLEIEGAVSPPPADSTPRTGARKGLTREVPEDVRKAMDDPASRMGNYVMLAQIGKGGMGSVWKAWDPKLARYVAVKFLLASTENDVMRFEREAQLAAGLRHPNIAPIYEFGEHLGRHYLVMEYIDGESLEKTKRSPGEVVATMIPACLAVDYAHQAGVIHRDLKPQNIMLNSKKWPYVMDFGLAKQVEGGSELSASGLIVGTPSYMPPEQAQGLTEQIDRRSDVYSLGATLYFLLTGSAPFKGPTPMDTLLKVAKEEPVAPRKHNPSIPAELEVITLKAMDKDPSRRYATAADLAADLERFSKGESILARPPSLHYLMIKAVRRNPFLFVSLALALVVVGVLGWTAFAPKPPAADNPLAAWITEFNANKGHLELTRYRPDEEKLRTLEASLARASSLGPEAVRQVMEWADSGIRPAEELLATWETSPPTPRLAHKGKAEDLARAVRAMQEVLKKASLAAPPKLDSIAGRAEKLAAYRGVFRLALNPAPFAKLHAMRGPGGILVREGVALVDAPLVASDADLTAPVVLDQLEIGDYDLELVNPGTGMRAFRIGRDQLVHDGHFLLTGDMGSPAGLRLVRLP